MLALARIHGIPWWRRLRAWARAKLHRCRDCRVLSTDEGIGGQCVQCGRIHGWMTREELRRAAIMPHIVPVRPFAHLSASAIGSREGQRLMAQVQRSYRRPEPTSMPGPPERYSA